MNNKYRFLTAPIAIVGYVIVIIIIVLQNTVFLPGVFFWGRTILATTAAIGNLIVTLRTAYEYANPEMHFSKYVRLGIWLRFLLGVLMLVAYMAGNIVVIRLLHLQ